MIAEPFTAVTTCPQCHLLDVHKMRSPKPAPTAAEMQAWRDRVTTTEVKLFGGRTVRTHYSEQPPRDESAYEVVRICRCGHEWGQV
ncbi:hypothetical protein [Nocardia wallacei]|uniref:hypothetical protein n=1 Tax=Nocardia wallacei TaxID=480035 RepID=UPI0024564636|nr:hypothetical protein [Nocardia wallacei]